MRWKCRVSPHIGILGIACIGLLVVPPPLGASVSGPGEDATAVGFGGGVASPDDRSTQIGHAILAAGGNSTDAAVAAAAALAVRVPDAGGLGGGSAVVHVEATTGEVTLIDGCMPLGALPAWRTALARWRSPDLAAFLDMPATLAGKHLAATLRTVEREATPSLTEGSLAGPVQRAVDRAGVVPMRGTPAVSTLTTQSSHGVRVAGGISASPDAAPVPPDAFVSVVVADRWGGVTAIVNSMGVRGGSGVTAGRTGVTIGAPMPSRCGAALPTVVLHPARGELGASAMLALAGTSGRKSTTNFGDPAASVRQVLADRALGAAGLEESVDSQGASVVAVELDADGSVHVASEGRRGGSAAVVHDD